MIKLARWILNSLLVFIGCILAVWMIIFSSLQSETIQKWSMKHILGYLENETGAQITIEKMGFAFPFSLYFNGLKLHYHGQPTLEIDQLKIACYSPELLNGKLVFPNIYAKGVYAKNLPEIPQSESQTDWSTLSLTIDHLIIKDIHLSTSVVDKLKLPTQVAL